MALQLDGNTGITYSTLNQDIKSLLLPKNWIINGMFDVWQRGVSQTTSSYGSDDRWSNEHSGSTKTHSQQAFTVGQTDVPNNPKYFSRTVVTSVVGASNYVLKQHLIEDVSKLAGKTITVSFWAKADANKSIAIDFVQYFGIGGSSLISSIGVQKFVLTTSWQRFTKTVALPSASGKTIGVNNSFWLRVWFDAGSGFNTPTDSLGNQSGTFDIANVSLVEGSVAIECQNQPYADALIDCLRYYYRLSGDSSRSCGFGKALGTTTLYCFIQHPVTMRKVPTVSYSSISCVDPGVGNFAITAIASSSETLFASQLGATTSGLTDKQMYMIRTDTNGFLAFDAEL